MNTDTLKALEAFWNRHSEDLIGGAYFSFKELLSRTKQEESQKPNVTDGHAWCPECKCSVPAIHITFEEMHDVCGQSIIWKEPVKLEQPTAPASLVEELARWVEREHRLLDEHNIPNIEDKRFHAAQCEVLEILSAYRPEKPTEPRPQEQEPCVVNDFDCSGPCPYADKNRLIPCNYVKKQCPIHSSPVKEEHATDKETK